MGLKKWYETFRKVCARSRTPSGASANFAQGLVRLQEFPQSLRKVSYGFGGLRKLCAKRGNDTAVSGN